MVNKIIKVDPAWQQLSSSLALSEEKFKGIWLQVCPEGAVSCRGLVSTRGIAIKFPGKVILLMVQKSCISWSSKYPIINRLSYMSGGGGFLPSVDLVSTVQKIYSMILFIEKCWSLPTGHPAGSKGTCAKAKFQGAKGFPKVWQIMEHVFLNMIPFSRDGHVDQNVPPINAFQLTTYQTYSPLKGTNIEKE